MKIVELTNNVTFADTIIVSVRTKEYKTLISLQNIGGFLRFNMTLLDENKERGASELDKLLPFLYDVFANKELIKEYFIK